MSKQPQVTVAIPTYNREELVPKAIESVLAQSYENWRMIIVDDASTDGTVEAIRPYLRDPRIDLVRLEENGGVARALNAALQHVQTPFMLHLDSDDWLEPTCLAKFVGVAEAVPDEVAVLYGASLVWDTTIRARSTPARVKRSSMYASHYHFVMRWRSAIPRFYRVDALRNVGGWDTNVLYDGRVVEDLSVISKLAASYGWCRLDAVLHNYRWHRKNESHRRRLSQRRFVRWLIRTRLKEWGGDYAARFTIKRRNVVPAVTLIPRKKGVPKRPGRRMIHKGTASIPIMDAWWPVNYEYTLPPGTSQRRGHPRR